MSLLGIFFKFSYLSFFVGIFIVFFTILILVYSLGSMRGGKGLVRYYVYLLLTALVSLGVVFSNHLIVFLVFWGFLGLLLYLLIGFGQKQRTPQTAKKALIIVGGTDALMILGIAIVWKLVGTFRMDAIHITLITPTAVIAYLCFVAAIFAKAGAMPFHTWVPDTAEDAPSSVTAFLPASLDKLLGIYFLVRISLDLFQMNAGMNTFLMAMGSLTIVCAVMMALIQHDLKRLLGCHAVSQVGYMVLGIGTGNPIGIAGGVFHMLNNAIFKSCLFLSAGAVEKKAGTTDLDKLGGLSKTMPVVYMAFLIASLAISGVPPLNGFFSKWMIYQGIIETGKQGSHWWILWLMAAMFGSALTLASFMKLVHAVFLGQSSWESQDPAKGGEPPLTVEKNKTPMTMWFPIVLLAGLCVLFGVFARQIPLGVFIYPSLNQIAVFSGTWSAGVATVLILLGIFVGVLIYLLGMAGKSRTTAPFIGGETLKQYPEMRMSGTEFYRTVQDMRGLKGIYTLAQKKVFDIYEVGGKGAQRLYSVLRYFHNGILPTYLSWCLLGMLALFYILLK
jgi:NADH:ubiquinone oxidoreductase subunit 5 (subunit L)/multisubunit Na+/H+ antiporter MnhA subunit